MALTSAQLAWCAAVLGAGTAGYNAPPVVKKIKEQVSPKKLAKGERAVRPTSRPRVVRIETALPPAPQSSTTIIAPCPTPGISFAENLKIPPIEDPKENESDWSWIPTGFAPPAWFGGGSPSRPITPGPGIPEPFAWSMLITGFGMVGVSMRRRRKGEVHGE